MTEAFPSQNTVVRTSRGLSIAGTRITLYDVMDYLTAGWPPTLIQHWLNLNEQQIADVIAYITQHQDAVQQEYQRVVQQAQEIQQYWEDKNREHQVPSANLPSQPDHEALRAKLRAWKTRLEQA
jgi:uncharacterized protein (DUF433 family)